ncbi:hypothetical protein [Novosphingobium sp. MBES04]|uniref:hypothetical protein n=1 Tax=Novosphingobium sp. MBES04 TaxID=1206458 RepID=UPI00057FD0E9|nr:hypothetical protein [Novosphingobium sp. MBES04]GAM07117.1 hypothetical conserved protein [Novosphingobium sp. MBES04]
MAFASQGPTQAAAADQEGAGTLEKRAALADGLAGALKACRLWVLHPDTWAAGPEPFLKDVGLGDAMGQVRSIAEVNQPPEAWREGNVYWRINATLDAGYVLVVSHRMPICQVTGGGDADLQPTVGEVLASPEFAEAWREVDEATRGDMVLTTFVSREEPDFTMVLSRATAPGARRDRVQVIASASFAPAGE